MSDPLFGGRTDSNEYDGRPQAVTFGRSRLYMDRSAASEIIGSLLILAITVALFSTVLVFVHSMDAPSEGLHATLVGKVVETEDGRVGIEIVHRGGHALDDQRVDIHILLGSDIHVCKVSDGGPNIGMTWEIGETWRYILPDDIDADLTTWIGVRMIDRQANVVIWHGDLN